MKTPKRSVIILINSLCKQWIACIHDLNSAVEQYTLSLLNQLYVTLTRQNEIMCTKGLLVKMPFIHSFTDSLRIYCLATPCQVLCYRHFSCKHNYSFLLKSLSASKVHTAHVISKIELNSERRGKNCNEGHMEKRPKWTEPKWESL